MGNHRIVVVEDDVFIRLDLMMHLRSGGHAIVGTADCAAEAVRVVERERPDLVLMDVRLLATGTGSTLQPRSGGALPSALCWSRRTSTLQRGPRLLRPIRSASWRSPILRAACSRP